MKKLEGNILYVSDMDGTLMGADSRVTPASAAMLRLARDEGAIFTVATARTPATVSELVKDLDMTIPCIVNTGGALWNPSTRLYSEVQFFPEDIARQAVDIYRRNGTPTFMYTWHDGMIHMYHPGPMSSVESDFARQRIGNPFKTLHPVDEMPEKLDEVILFFATQPDNLALPVYRELGSLPANPMFYHDMFGPEMAILEVFPATTSKDQGIKRLKKLVGADSVVAFGDNMNDIPMLQAADLAVAVENAVPEVKEAADIVIGSNTDDAVARFILEHNRKHKNIKA